MVNPWGVTDLFLGEWGVTVLRRVGLRDFLAKLLDLFFGGVGDLDLLALRDLDLLEAGDRDLLGLGDLFDFLLGVRDLEEEDDPTPGLLDRL